MSSEDVQKLLISVVTALLAGITGFFLRPKATTNIAQAVTADVEHRIRKSKPEAARDDEMSLLAMRTAAGSTSLLDRLLNERTGEFAGLHGDIVRIDGRIDGLDGKLNRILAKLGEV